MILGVFGSLANLLLLVPVGRFRLRVRLHRCIFVVGLSPFELFRMLIGVSVVNSDSFGRRDVFAERHMLFLHEPESMVLL